MATVDHQNTEFLNGQLEVFYYITHRCFGRIVAVLDNEPALTKGREQLNSDLHTDSSPRFSPHVITVLILEFNLQSNLSIWNSLTELFFQLSWLDLLFAEDDNPKTLPEAVLLFVQESA